MRFDIVLPPGERFTRESSGAVSTVSLELARCLTTLGHTVRVVTPRAPGQLHDEVEVFALRYGTDRVRLASIATRVARRAVATLTRRGPRSALEAYRSQALGAVSRGAADVVILHNEPVLAAAVAEGRRATTVLWLHNLMVGADAEALANLDGDVRVVCVSDAVRLWTSQALAVPTSRMSVIHNGVDTARFRPRSQPSSQGDWRGEGRRSLRVVLHGRIDPNKGQELAAQAVAALRAEGVDVELTLLGSIVTFGLSKEQQVDFAARIDAAVAASGARVTGWVAPSAVPSRLREFDVALLLPTAPDPFPLAGLEAMASGLAVVAIPLGGVAEMVGEAALLVDPTPDSVAGALRALNADAALLTHHQQLSRERAAAFTWPEAADRLVALVASRVAEG